MLHYIIEFHQNNQRQQSKETLDQHRRERHRQVAGQPRQTMDANQIGADRAGQHQSEEITDEADPRYGVEIGGRTFAAHQRVPAISAENTLDDRDTEHQSQYGPINSLDDG